MKLRGELVENHSAREAENIFALLLPGSFFLIRNEDYFKVVLLVINSCTKLER